jgi:pimeloyl-ACP methyl ester carboxylesterase
MRYIYLHGFASGPDSSKATYFRRRFAEQGVELHAPDLAGGDFEHLTVTGQLRVIDALAKGEPVALIGSSMGGYLAALYASAHPEVERVVLLAPAFDFLRRWPERLGPQGAEWERTGTMQVYHYADACYRPLGYGLVEDSRNYPGEPSFTQPALIFHGTRDDVVPAECSVAFAARHPNARLRLLDSDHQLTDAADAIWSDARPFLLGERIHPSPSSGR